MKTKCLLIVVFCFLVCVLVMNGLVFARDKSADPYGNGRPLGPRGSVTPTQPDQVPEPSTLLLLGTGLTGIGVYLYSKHRKDKK